MTAHTPATPGATAPTAAASVLRVEVRPAPGRADPRADAVLRHARTLDVPARACRSARVYLVQAPTQGHASGDAPQRLVSRLLADPVTETALVGASPTPPGWATVEVHPLPGVMDPAAQSVRDAAAELLGLSPHDLHVSTGVRYDLEGLSSDAAMDLARRALANPVVHQIVSSPWRPAALPAGREAPFTLRRVPLRHLDDAALMKMSREAHLFLSLDEMRALREHYRGLEREPTDIELETFAQTWSEHCVHKTLKSTITYRAGTSAGGTPAAGEHDPLSFANRPNHILHPDGSVTIHNLLKSTVAAATFELIADGVDWALSVFKDNSGVVALDDRFGVCIKVETHNHPSAIEPYGGAATGIGGCIRDVIGTGLGAKPIASTDVFCVAPPDAFTTENTESTEKHGATAGPAAAQPAPGSASPSPSSVALRGLRGEVLPPGCLPPRRILADVVAGVRDYGNRMGIPTVNGAVAFDARYVGNPLVFCGCVGLIPRHLIKGQARPGDLIVALGGRTGRDGIHGATFSSTELEHTSADEFSHAVQIGNAIEEKRTMDAILRARDAQAPDGQARDGQPAPLFTAITDCGAGGFSSAVGEMGAELGASVNLDAAPLKYAGLTYTEVWISEAQERMVLAVPPHNLEALRAICKDEHVELAVLGTFGTPQRDLILHWRGTEVGRLSMHFLHEGLPTPTREAVWTKKKASGIGHQASGNAKPATPPLTTPPLEGALLALLKHPDIASKHWIIRQYDHEVQGNTLIKPLTGPLRRGPSDASVIEPVPGSGRGVAIACGLQTPVGDPALTHGDPYLMALAAIDECVRNLVCAGADPARTAILDNFCWPSCQKPENLGALVRAAEGCYDGAKAYRTPFVSGKDSLNNQLRYTDPATGQERLIEIPPTLLITGLAIVPDLARLTTMDAKRPGNLLVLVGETPADSASGGPSSSPALGASRFAALFLGDAGADLPIPRTDLSRGPAAARAVAAAIARPGLVRSAHDVSDGGLLCAVAEMLIAGSTPERPIGATLDLSRVHADAHVAAFSEAPSRYVLEVAPGSLPALRAALGDTPCAVVGTLDDSGALRVPAPGSGSGSGPALNLPVETLAQAWLSPLDW